MRGLRRILRRIGTKPVADSGIGQNEAWTSRVLFELFSQLADKHPKILRLSSVRRPPDRREQHPVRQHLPGVFYHVLYEIVLGGCQFHQLATEPHFTSIEVHREVAVGADGLRAVCPGRARKAGRLGPVFRQARTRGASQPERRLSPVSTARTAPVRAASPPTSR